MSLRLKVKEKLLQKRASPLCKQSSDVTLGKVIELLQKNKPGSRAITDLTIKLERDNMFHVYIKGEKILKIPRMGGPIAHVIPRKGVLKNLVEIIHAIRGK